MIMVAVIVRGLHTFAVGAMQILAHNTSGTGGMPRIGQEIGRGAESVVYENLDQPGWVVKDTPPVNRAEVGRIIQDFDDAGVHDAAGNMIFGHTADNPTP